jgi:hypothetical protein
MQSGSTQNLAQSRGNSMIYFALNPDGLLYNLGDHGDFEAANDTADNMHLDAIWLLDEFEAQNWAEFIISEIKNTKKAMEMAA